MPKKVKLKTGIGYVVEKESGKVLYKFDLPPDEHTFPYNVDVIEVSSRDELASIEVGIEIGDDMKSLILRLLDDAEVANKIKEIVNKRS